MRPARSKYWKMLTWPVGSSLETGLVVMTGSKTGMTMTSIMYLMPGPITHLRKVMLMYLKPWSALIRSGARINMDAHGPIA